LISLLLLLFLAGDLDAAEKALAAGKPQEALDLLGDLAAGADADVRVYVVQGRALLALGESEAAVEPLIRASDLAPDDQALARDAALACWRSASGEYGRLYLEDARRLAERAGDEAFLAEIEFALGDLEPALERYRKLEGVHAKMRVGECLAGLGKEDEARAAYGEALEAALEADDLPQAFRAAFAAGKSGRFLAWLDERIAAQPEDLSYRLYRGFVRSEAGMYAEAAEDLRLVVAKKPAPLEAVDRLSFVLLQHGVRQQDQALIAEAADLARAVLDREPTHRAAWDRVAWIAGYAWVNGDVPRAYELLADLHGRDPLDATTALNFAAMARRLGKYDVARAAYDRLLAEAPDDPDVLNDLGILLDGMGDRAAARKLWQQVLEERPNDLNALENLFTDAWERGDRPVIEEYRKRGLEAARASGGPVDRWLWFGDRLRWAPSGHGD